MNRRHFIHSLAASLALLPSRARAGGRGPRILLRSSWQTVNIGDIAHTPGILALLEKHLPEVEVWLWPVDAGNGVTEMLLRRFPKLTIVHGKDAAAGAFTQCDFLLHGSGPSLLAAPQLAQWRAQTGKPYGVYGITLAEAAFHGGAAAAPDTLSLLNGAQFVYFRDSVSLDVAKKAGVAAPVVAFGPDAAFATDLRNDAAAEAFLQAHGLEEGKFLCCIPRMRYTPFWKIKPGRPFDAEKDARNQAMKEHDHAPLRKAIVDVVRQTGMKVLVCPEDSSQMEVGKEMLVDPLPAAVKAGVAWRESYWLTDEALSTYVRSAGLFGNEMHSPIMCVGNGIPAIVCRWAEQTSKGFMWRDVGLGDWLFNLDNEEEVARVAPAVLAMAADPVAAREKAAKARAFVQGLHAESMGVVARAAASVTKVA